MNGIEMLVFALGILVMFESAYSKDQYTIGGLAITGSVRLFQQWNSTFSTYLTIALRQNPKFANITFKLVSLDFYSTFTLVHFFVLSPSPIIRNYHPKSCGFISVQR
jgi:hypothetical protein